MGLFTKKQKLLAGPEGSGTQTDVLIRLASDPQFPVEKLEKLIALKNHEEDRACAKEFDRNFAMMQAEFPILPRTKKGHVGNMYCPLEKMVQLCRPTIGKYLFSYSWDQTDVPEEPDRKLITLTISGYGHSKKFSMKGYIENPKQSNQGRAVTNRNQELGSTDTYMHRYTFKGGFGLAEDEEDLDGYVPPTKNNSVYSEAEIVDEVSGASPVATGKSAPVPDTLATAYVDAMHLLRDLAKVEGYGAIIASIGSIINRKECKGSAENMGIILAKLRGTKPKSPTQFVADLQAALKL